MSARTKARKRAIDILYAADVREIGLDAALADEAARAMNEPDRAASWLYARDIVDGVRDHGPEIDDTIASHAQGWTIERMPMVDRAILRMAVWEVLFNDEVPAGVAIAEAVEQAKALSTDDSARFVNGVLAAVAKQGA